MIIAVVLLTLAVVLLLLAVGILIGYTVRQREELAETHDQIVDLWLENADLRRDNAAHVSSLEMVLYEVGASQ